MVLVPLVGKIGWKGELKRDVPLVVPEDGSCLVVGWKEVVGSCLVVGSKEVDGSCLALVVEKPNKSDKDRDDIIDVCATEVVGIAVVSWLVGSWLVDS